MKGATKVFKNANLDAVQADWTRTLDSGSVNSAVNIVRYPSALIVRTNQGNTLVFTPRSLKTPRKTPAMNGYKCHACGHRYAARQLPKRCPKCFRRNRPA